MSRKRSYDEMSSDLDIEIKLPDDRTVRALLQDIDIDVDDRCEQILEQARCLAASIQSSYRRRIDTLPETVRRMTVNELVSSYQDNFEDVTRLNVAQMQESLEQFAQTVARERALPRFELDEKLCGMTPMVRTALRKKQRLNVQEGTKALNAGVPDYVPGTLRRSTRKAAQTAAALITIASTPAHRLPPELTTFQRVFSSANPTTSTVTTANNAPFSTPSTTRTISATSNATMNRMANQSGHHPNSIPAQPGNTSNGSNGTFANTFATAVADAVAPPLVVRNTRNGSKTQANQAQSGQGNEEPSGKKKGKGSRTKGGSANSGAEYESGAMGDENVEPSAGGVDDNGNGCVDGKHAHRTSVFSEAFNVATEKASEGAQGEVVPVIVGRTTRAQQRLREATRMTRLNDMLTKLRQPAN